MRDRQVWVEGAQGTGPGKASGALKFLRKSGGMEKGGRRLRRTGTERKSRVDDSGWLCCPFPPI